MGKLWKEHRGLILTLVCFGLILGAALAGFTALSRANSQQQLALIRQEVSRAAVACYATEGFYPADLDYLKEHYGLRWDESRYIVSYDRFAANIMPDMAVLVRGDGL